MSKGPFKPPAATNRIAVIKRAAIWLACLAPFFYLTYGTANWLASLRSHVPNLAFGWEKSIPFVAWMIIPYWSINAFYALCLFINSTPRAVDTLGRRYLTIQIIAVSCFIAFPLQAIFVRPPTTGLPGFMFEVLGGFDKPFNQAPSLHIALLVVIWDHLRGKLPRPVRLVWHAWCFLIGISVLATWQHHVIDIPTGMMLGLFAAWLFPRNAPSPLAGLRLTKDAKAKRLGFYYLAGALVFFAASVAGVWLSPAALLLLWPCLSLAIVSIGYLGAGPQVFQKHDGRVSLASLWLLAPYRRGVRINIWFWTHSVPASVEITAGVYIGRFPKRGEVSAFLTIIDMTGELAAPYHPGTQWHSFPTLDLIALDRDKPIVAARLIEPARQRGAVLVCCALGFQRSAVVIARWLLASGRAKDADTAVAMIAKAGRRVHIQPSMIAENRR